MSGRYTLFNELTLTRALCYVTPRRGAVRSVPDLKALHKAFLHEDLVFHNAFHLHIAMSNSIKLLTGNSHPTLAKQVADRLGIELTKILVVQYSNQETSITIGESVRDEDGQSTLRTQLLQPRLTL
jgi:N-terminal domain of ribose phosphate pyrophosphokinase